MGGRIKIEEQNPPIERRAFREKIFLAKRDQPQGISERNSGRSLFYQSFLPLIVSQKQQQIPPVRCSGSKVSPTNLFTVEEVAITMRALIISLD